MKFYDEYENTMQYYVGFVESKIKRIKNLLPNEFFMAC
jgi:hypothetical protein